jgi:hypothetical protein
MINKLGTLALVAFVMIGLGTAPVDFLCMILWHVDGAPIVLDDGHNHGAHHPDAPDSHLHGDMPSDGISNSLVAFLIDDSAILNSLGTEELLTTKRVLIEVPIFIENLTTKEILQPPELFS